MTYIPSVVTGTTNIAYSYYPKEDPIIQFVQELFLLDESHLPEAFELFKKYEIEPSRFILLIELILKNPHPPCKRSTLFNSLIPVIPNYKEIMYLLLESNSVYFYSVYLVVPKLHAELMEHIFLMPKGPDLCCMLWNHLLQDSGIPTYNKRIIWSSFFSHCTDNQMHHLAMASMKIFNEELGKHLTLMTTGLKPFMETLLPSLSRDSISILIESLVNAIDSYDQNQSPALVALLNNWTESPFLAEFIYEKLPNYSSKIQGHVLWSLPLQTLSHCFNKLTAEKNFLRMIQMLNSLLSHSDSYDQKCAYIQECLSKIQTTETLFIWLKQLVASQSPALPYLWFVLSDAHFNLLLDPSHTKLRTELMCTCSQFIRDAGETIYRLSKERVNLLTRSTIHFNSLAPPKLRKNTTGQCETLSELKSYAASATLTEFNTKIFSFITSFQEIPPFLLALAMKTKRHKSWITACIPYFQMTQLAAIARSIHHEKDIPTFENILALAKNDQKGHLVRFLAPAMLKEFLLFKHRQFNVVLSDIKANYTTVLNNTFQKKPLTYLETINICKKQRILISYILNPFVNLLSELSREIDYRFQFLPKELLPLPSIIIECNTHQIALEGPGGFFELMKEWMKVNTKELFNMTQNLLTEYQIDSWESVGIFEAEDLIMLGFDGSNPEILKRYLSQPELKSVYKFFELMPREELDKIKEKNPNPFNLKQTAEKWGYTSST